MASGRAHARLIAIRELDTGGLKGIAYVVESAVVGLALPEFKQRDRRLGYLRYSGQFVLRPVEERPCSATLSRRH